MKYEICDNFGTIKIDPIQTVFFLDQMNRVKIIE
jgi:hypothetical protein